SNRCRRRCVKPLRQTAAVAAASNRCVKPLPSPLRQTAAVAAASNRCVKPLPSPLRQTIASNPRGEMPWSGPPSVAAAAVVKTAAAATLSIAAAARSSPWDFCFYYRAAHKIFPDDRREEGKILCAALYNQVKQKRQK
ncbi:MAG: hypothetical protein GY805_01725, partial [Chloroflexi bacterium]|nr:hypothetical protein [Chloroflexota bacterium]